MENTNYIELLEDDVLQLDGNYAMQNEIAMQGENKKSIYCVYVKPVLDVVLSGLALIVLSPVFLAIAIAIKLQDGGSVFYSQIRCGKDNKPFKMYKFRSMCLNADEKLAELQKLNERDGPVFKITGDPRITKVGKFIRKTCLDELPQLINILKLDMSIVGPRPPLPSEVEQYSAYHLQRLDVTPGLTCYWQANKTDATTFDEWVEMDIKYINEISFKTDVKLILKTILVVFKHKGDE